MQQDAAGGQLRHMMGNHRGFFGTAYQDSPIVTLYTECPLPANGLVCSMLATISIAEEMGLIQRLAYFVL